MPTPGSHQYDVERSKLRSTLESRGLPDDEAEAQAREAARDDDAVSPAMTDDRARGPLGERGGGGDPGDVIELRSPAFSDHAAIPDRHTATDGNIVPPLEWGPVPEGTAELALVCEDLDADDRPIVHWLVTGIDPATRAVDDAGPPDGAVAWPNETSGGRGYDGPQPPAGDDAHRYAFRLLALDEPLEVDPSSPAATVREVLEERRTAAGTLVGLFAR